MMKLISILIINIFLNDKYILFFSEMENNENDDDMELFIKSLAMSLRATDCRKIESADIQHGIDQVFTFCSESEQLPSRFEKIQGFKFSELFKIFVKIKNQRSSFSMPFNIL